MKVLLVNVTAHAGACTLARVYLHVCEPNAKRVSYVLQSGTPQDVSVCDLSSARVHLHAHASMQTGDGLVTTQLYACASVPCVNATRMAVDMFTLADVPKNAYTLTLTISDAATTASLDKPALLRDDVPANNATADTQEVLRVVDFCVGATSVPMSVAFRSHPNDPFVADVGALDALACTAMWLCGGSVFRALMVMLQMSVYATFYAPDVTCWEGVCADNDVLTTLTLQLFADCEDAAKHIGKVWRALRGQSLQTDAGRKLRDVAQQYDAYALCVHDSISKVDHVAVLLVRCASCADTHWPANLYVDTVSPTALLPAASLMADLAKHMSASANKLRVANGSACTSENWWYGVRVPRVYDVESLDHVLLLKLLTFEGDHANVPILHCFEHGGSACVSLASVIRATTPFAPDKRFTTHTHYTKKQYGLLTAASAADAPLVRASTASDAFPVPPFAFFFLHASVDWESVRGVCDVFFGMRGYTCVLHERTYAANSTRLRIVAINKQ